MKYPSMGEVTKQYWFSSDFEALSHAKTIADIFVIARQVRSRMNDTVAQVCGPVNNGGRGSVEKNLEYLSQMIQALQYEGVNVFDQMPFEETIHRIINDASSGQKYENVLTDFYEPLFRLKMVQALYFVPGWEGSRGAVWEHTMAKELGIEVHFL